MKKLGVKKKALVAEGRWDLDYHLPATEILRFTQVPILKVSEVAEVSKLKRNPEEEPEEIFKYVDISSIDTGAGNISYFQEILGIEAPSRARKIILENDIIISTVRPTRGAVAVVPAELNNEICSTGFTVLRVKSINPHYLRFALRLNSTREQFRKFATGSSYPAILDGDVLKTKIPIPSIEEQDSIVYELLRAETERASEIARANEKLHLWEKKTITHISDGTYKIIDVPDSSKTTQGILEQVRRTSENLMQSSKTDQPNLFEESFAKIS